MKKYMWIVLFSLSCSSSSSNQDMSNNSADKEMGDSSSELADEDMIDESSNKDMSNNFPDDLAEDTPSPDECRDDSNCQPMEGSNAYKNPENVKCRMTLRNGRQCSECLSDQDCPGNDICANQMFCMSP